MSVETFPRLDIGSYAAKYPNSSVLQLLANTTDYEKTREGWWEALVDEYHAGLALDGTVAAYYTGMHPVNLEKMSEESGPENARRLVAGEMFAFHMPYSGGLMNKYSGVLAEDAIALLGNPSGDGNGDGFANVDFGLHLKNRKDTLRVDTTSYFSIGEDEIAAHYVEFMRSASDTEKKHPLLFGRRIVETAAVVKRLGIEVDDRQVKNFEQRLVGILSKFVIPYDRDSKVKAIETVFREPENAIEMLEYLHVFNPSLADQRIKEFSTNPFYVDYDILSTRLVNTVAQIRSPYALDSLSDAEKKLSIAQAKVEVFGYWTESVDASAEPETRITPASVWD